MSNKTASTSIQINNSESFYKFIEHNFLLSITPKEQVKKIFVKFRNFLNVQSIFFICNEFLLSTVKCKISNAKIIVLLITFRKIKILEF